ncbi:MAG: dTDP-4-dehydrorhamnose 3,5-epimerase [Ignavibacteriales bacterium]|nr:dTDP-4-dehydrorhamnose 3,5-epimerase [Ignavibacteriales bacterium]
MPFTILSKHLNGIVVLKTEIFKDDRGYFMEVFREDTFKALGIPSYFPQDNHSRSAKDVVRGLHFQWNPAMGKLMRVIVGTAFLVAVDIRKNSPTLGKWFGIEASAENKLQVWAPPGFARGFCVLSDVAELQYKCTGIYNPNGESNILWNDPDIGIDWPTKNPVLSQRDSTARTLAQWLTSSESDNFRY